MKSIKTTVIFTLISLSTIASGVKSASAQSGYDMWTDSNHDTSNCYGYTSCYVDNWGQVRGSNDAYNPGSYYPEDYTWQKQLEW